MPSTSELLAQVPFFSLLDDQERSVLAERVEVASFPKDGVIFNYGDPGDALYVVISGEVEVFFKNDTGERIVLETATAGDFFGEVSLLDGGPRTASAVATTEVQALEVDRDDLDELFRLKPGAAMDLLSATGRRLRKNAELLRHTATRNVNEEVEDLRTTVMKIADWISEFSGSLPFLFIHIGLFFTWIILNVGLLPWGGFDPFPFGLLTMVVSLEAIILSVFVLLSQNRQAARDRVRGDIEYDINLKAELEIAHLHEKVDQMNSELLKKLATLERAATK
ncbi:MAG: DUF1003 domain-containing protein [Polyangiaceae bacterium]|nr:DUF1003 domain-containing protein [Polyangiaceae bacterium]